MGAMLKVIYDTVRDASLKADSGDQAAYQTESIIQQAKDILRVCTATFKVFLFKLVKTCRSLQNAETFLIQEGGDALKQAEERSEKFGQQSERMSKISRDARLLADKWVKNLLKMPMTQKRVVWCLIFLLFSLVRHEEDAADIERMANEAFNTSTEAFKLAERATEQLFQTQ